MLSTLCQQYYGSYYLRIGLFCSWEEDRQTDTCLRWCYSNSSVKLKLTLNIFCKSEDVRRSVMVVWGLNLSPVVDDVLLHCRVPEATFHRWFLHKRWRSLLWYWLPAPVWHQMPRLWKGCWRWSNDRSWENVPSGLLPMLKMLVSFHQF